jgi:tetratricopeptide (TPR) repeat protein
MRDELRMLLKNRPLLFKMVDYLERASQLSQHSSPVIDPYLLITSHHFTSYYIMRFFILSIALISFFACAQQDVSKGKNTVSNEVFPTLLQRAEALRNGKEWDDVQNFYGTQCAELRKNADNSEARLKLAECFIQEARVTGEHPHYYPAALGLVDRVIVFLDAKSTPTINEKDLLFRALSHKASIQLSLHDFATALKTAERAVSINPYNAYIYGCLVDANVELGNYTAAVEMCDKMVGIRPDLRSYARVSYLREIHDDHKGAIEAMKMAVAAGYPGYEQTEWARLQLGNLYQKYGTAQQAENEYLTSLQARENYPFAVAACASLEAEKGNYAKALETYKKAAEILPEISFYIEMAQIYKKMGDAAALDTTIGQVKEMFKEDMSAGHNINLEAARFYLELTDNIDEALTLAQTEFARRPNNKDVNQLMADIYLKKGDKVEAAKYLKKTTV